MRTRHEAPDPAAGGRRGFPGRLGAPAPVPGGGTPMNGGAIVLVAAAALIDADGRVLVAQRPEGKTMAGLWEFPGGKIALGETPEAALVRELAEELAIEVCETCLYPLSFASHAYQDFHLLMPLYVCRQWQGIPTPQEGQGIRWLYPNALAALAMPPADAPLVQALRDYL